MPISDVLKFTLPAVLPGPMRGHLQMGGQVSPAGDRLDVNSRWLEWNGRPWLPIMGEFHYSRYDSALWEDELRKIKAGGVTMLATYVFWIHHEEIEGCFNWSGRRDLRRFVELAGRIGLRVALRIGPFCHGEVRNGGVPDWLYGQPFEIRSNEPRYLARVERLYREVFVQTKGLFFAEGGPIIAVQVENEYLSTGAPWETTHFPDTEWETAGAGGETHMAVLRDLAERSGFSPVLWVCTGWGATRFPADRFLPMFGGYAYYGWQDDPEKVECSPNFVYRDMWTQAHLPHGAFDPLRVPYACCEIGGGMQTYYRHRPLVPPESVAAMNNVILANGSNVMGTYVYHGGINPAGVRGWLNEYRVPRRSYDFQAPLGEFGQRRPHYDLLRRFYYFIQSAQERLASAAPLLPDDQPLVKPNDLESLRAGVRADALGRGFLFINNFQDHVALPAREDVRITVRTPLTVLSFPVAGRYAPASGVNAILPFHFDLAGIELRQGGTQFMASRCVVDQPERFFFFVPAGMETPHYLFTGRVEVTAESPGVRCEPRGADTLVIVPADRRSGFVVGTGSAEVRVTTLTENESLGFWQESCGARPVTLLTDAGVIFHPDGFELYQTGHSVFHFSLLDDGRSGAPSVSSGTVVAEGVADGFLRFAATLPVWRGGIAVTPLKAGKSHVTLNPDAFAGIHELFLRIEYQGDTGMAFIGGEMVHDHFHNGRPWEIGLRQYRPRVEDDGIVLRVVPKPCTGGSCTQDAMGAGAVTGGDFKDLAIRSIDAVPEYRVRLRWKS